MSRKDKKRHLEPEYPNSVKRIVTTGDIELPFNGQDHIYSKNNNSSSVNKPVVIEEKEISNKGNLSCDQNNNDINLCD